MKSKSPFFQLKSPFSKLDEAAFNKQLTMSKHLANILYEPDKLSNKKFESLTFENVSFSKTLLRKVEFIDCTFKNCLFIGTRLYSVEIHNSTFTHCNFYKARFRDVYANPKQFRNAVTEKGYSNVAMTMYHELRADYTRGAYYEFVPETEWAIRSWSNVNLRVQAKRRSQNWFSWIPKYTLQACYGFLFGYGFRIRNIFMTTSILFSVLLLLNCHLWYCLFATPNSYPELSLANVLNFTVSALTTSGNSVAEPLTGTGQALFTLNVLIGITVFTSFLNALFRRIIR